MSEFLAVQWRRFPLRASVVRGENHACGKLVTQRLSLFDFLKTQMNWAKVWRSFLTQKKQKWKLTYIHWYLTAVTFGSYMLRNNNLCFKTMKRVKVFYIILLFIGINNSTEVSSDTNCGRLENYESGKREWCIFQ